MQSINFVIKALLKLVQITVQNYLNKVTKLNITWLTWNIEATCLQHEIDHLNGKLFVDHISKLKKNRIIKKLEKIKKTKNY